MLCMNRRLLAHQSITPHWPVLAWKHFQQLETSSASPRVCLGYSSLHSINCLYPNSGVSCFYLSCASSVSCACLSQLTTVCQNLGVTFCPSFTLAVLLSISNTSVWIIYSNRSVWISVSREPRCPKRIPIMSQFLDKTWVPREGGSRKKESQSSASGAKIPVKDSKPVQQTQILLQAQNWTHVHKGSVHNLCSHPQLC